MEVVKRIVNLTPHGIVLRTGDGPETDITIPPTAPPARVDSAPGHVSHAYTGCPVPVHHAAAFGAVSNLPAPEPGTLYIVSLMVAQRVRELDDRTDVVAPGTGPLDGAVRYVDGPQKGQIQAVTRLVRG